MFLLAAERLQVAPERCVVVEDSGPGVAAGVAAGMPTLGIRREPRADLSAADAVVDELSAAAILSLLALTASPVGGGRGSIHSAAHHSIRSSAASSDSSRSRSGARTSG